MFKLLALDMDGTLLNSNKIITNQTVDAINHLLNENIHVVISSGRCLIELSDYKSKLKNMKYAILTCGSLIYDFVNHTPLSTHYINRDDCLKIVQLATINDVMVQLMTVNESVAQPKYINLMADLGLKVYADMFNRICTKCDDLNKFLLERDDGILKINLYFRTVDSRDQFIKNLQAFNLKIIPTGFKGIEISPPNINKSTGLIELCNILNIDINDTVAIGDAMNDFDIIKVAGCGVAMGNAIDEIKSIADFITTDNDNNGVLNAINKLF